MRDQPKGIASMSKHVWNPHGAYSGVLRTRDTTMTLRFPA